MSCEWCYNAKGCYGEPRRDARSGNRSGVGNRSGNRSGVGNRNGNRSGIDNRNGSRGGTGNRSGSRSGIDNRNGNGNRSGLGDQRRTRVTNEVTINGQASRMAPSRARAPCSPSPVTS
jgi:hypothetical protein